MIEIIEKHLTSTLNTGTVDQASKGAMEMVHKSELRRKNRRTVRSARLIFVAAVGVTLFVTITQAQQKPANVEGTWHVAVPGWGIEDHLLVVQQNGSRIAGTFEFANIKGTVTGQKVSFDVTNEKDGKTMLQFEGTVAGETMKGAVTSPRDGPLLRHRDPSLATTTEWTAKREPTGPDR